MAKKIVIVDDDPVIVQGMLIGLGIEGYQTECMTTGRHTRELVAKAKPDLIFLDVKLDGGLDGRTITEELKSDPALRHTPIVLISANTNLKKEVKACGADDYLEKPFAVTDIVRKAKKHIPADKKEKGKKLASQAEGKHKR